MKKHFFPVAKITTICILISVVAACYWPPYQMGVKNGLLLERFTCLCLLHFLILHTTFAGCAMLYLDSDKLPCSVWMLQHCHSQYWLFSKFSWLPSFSTKCGRMLLPLYIGDMLIIGDDWEGWSLKVFLTSQFNTKDLGPLGYFLGIVVAYCPQTTFLKWSILETFFRDQSLSIPKLLALHLSSIRSSLLLMTHFLTPLAIDRLYTRLSLGLP